MSEGLLSLQWNNHKSTLHHMLSNVRRKECYADTTLACDGKLYPVHKLVLSMCSDYFEQIFANTQCKHPVIVLKDIKQDELECLLNYMYVGEVNVVQEKLSGLIKAAECLKIKGLAVPDEDPGKITSSRHHGSRTDKRTSDVTYSGSDSKRRKYDSGSDNNKQINNYNSRDEESRRYNDRSRLRSDTSNTSDCSNRNQSNSTKSSDVNASYEKAERDFSRTHARERSTNSSQKPGSLSPEIVAEEQEDIKAEEVMDEPQPPAENDSLVIEEPVSYVKEEPVDDAVYLSDSNSVDAKGSLLESLSGGVGGGDAQMHFMEELLGQNPSTEQGHMGVGEYGDLVEGTDASTSRSGQQQQQMEEFMLKEDQAVNTGVDRHPVPLYVSLFGMSQQCLNVKLSQVQSSMNHPENSLVTSQSALSYDNVSNSLLHEEHFNRNNDTLLNPSFSKHGQRQDKLYENRALFSSDMILEKSLSKNRNSRQYNKVPHQCSFCSYSSFKKSDVTNHLRIHTGEKPYSCEHCHYSCSHVSNLKSHMKRHHQNKEQN